MPNWLRNWLTNWFGWPGYLCPDCAAKPMQKHYAGCPTGAWDGGTWA